VIQKKYNGHPIDEEILRSLLTFSFFFTITIAIIALGLALIGLDWTTALSTSPTCLILRPVAAPLVLLPHRRQPVKPAR
jgi:trk system potassium uptake protein TrkH